MSAPDIRGNPDGVRNPPPREIGVPPHPEAGWVGSPDDWYVVRRPSPRGGTAGSSRTCRLPNRRQFSFVREEARLQAAAGRPLSIGRYGSTHPHLVDFPE